MSKAVKLSDKLVEEAKHYAAVSCRSVPGQIEYWSKIGKIVEDNPDLPYEFIKDILISLEDVKAGNVTEYKFGPLDPED